MKRASFGRPKNLASARLRRDAIAGALFALRDARRTLRAFGAGKAARATERAIKSTEGAYRHADLRIVRLESEGRL